MRWDDRVESENVEDKRQQMLTSAEIGARIGLAGAGLALFKYGKAKWTLVGALLLLLLAFIGFGVFPQSGQRFLQAFGYQPSQTAEQRAASQKRLRFVNLVLGETEQVWQKIYTEQGKLYAPPSLILYQTAIHSACGPAINAIGPFYCSNDKTVYLDDGFFVKMREELNAPGEFASAYVIAHEVGHHIQNLDGTLDKIAKEQANVDTKTANALTVKLELQADCYAGVWANKMQAKQVADAQDIADAITAARKTGDDNLQKERDGYVVPDSFTHGSAEQRVKWFERGLTTGNPKSCDSFANNM